MSLYAKASAVGTRLVFLASSFRRVHTSRTFHKIQAGGRTRAINTYSVIDSCNVVVANGNALVPGVHTACGLDNAWRDSRTKLDDWCSELRFVLVRSQHPSLISSGFDQSWCACHRHDNEYASRNSFAPELHGSELSERCAGFTGLAKACRHKPFD